MSLSKISKDEAAKLADIVTKPKTDAINARVSAFHEQVVKIYVDSLPVNILEVADKHRNLFEFSSVRLNIGGCYLTSFKLPKGVPSVAQRESYYKLDAEKYDFLLKEWDAISSIRDEIKRLNSEIAESITSLRTAKECVKNYPETAQFFSTYQSNSSLPVLSTDAIRVKLDSIII